MLELFAISSGVAPAICFFTIFDKVAMGQMKCLVEYLCTLQKFREGLIPHITLADRKGNGVLVVKWQVMYNCIVQLYMDA